MYAALPSRYTSRLNLQVVRFVVRLPLTCQVAHSNCLINKQVAASGLI